MDNRYSVKFETSLYEQTFKLRTGGFINHMEDVKQYVSASFADDVLTHFNHMHQMNLRRQSEMTPSEDDEFETII